MRPIYDNTVIHLDITNACHLKCANCTRHVGHHRASFFMDLDTVRKGLQSLVDFPGRVGLMGGEPCLHPQFDEICALYREYIPRRRREFWTAGWKWEEKLSVIRETFDDDRITYNDHTQHTGKHQPLLVAIDEVVPDEALRKELIDNCWIQAQWSATITPKGAFFCEVAAALDMLFDGPGGYPIEPGWWDKTPDQFQDQVERYCGKCSAAIPMEAHPDGRGGRDGPTVDTVSSWNLARLKAANSPKVAKKQVRISDDAITADQCKAHLATWNPSHFRDFEANNPEDVQQALKEKANAN